MYNIRVAGNEAPELPEGVTPEVMAKAIELAREEQARRQRPGLGVVAKSLLGLGAIAGVLWVAKRFT